MRIFIFLAGLLFLAGCDNPQSRGFDFPAPPANLINKVFITSGGMDSACQNIPQGTDFFQTLIFVNDSQFVRVINTCCGAPGEDFPFEAYYKGTWVLNDSILSLNFSPGAVYNYLWQDTLGSSDTIPHSKTHLENEKVNEVPLHYRKYSCGIEVYFKQLDGDDFKGEYISPEKDQPEKTIKDLKESEAWGKLFPK